MDTQERTTERFMHNLFGWVHPGFSVFAGEAISSEQQLERVALLEIQTPPDPRTGATVRADSLNIAAAGVLMIAAHFAVSRLQYNSFPPSYPRAKSVRSLRLKQRGART